MHYRSLYSTLFQDASRYARLLLYIVLANVPLTAEAAVITNLSQKNQVIKESSPAGWETVSIAANETYRVQGRIKILFDGREITIGHDEEYAIWNDGTIGPQRAERHINSLR